MSSDDGSEAEPGGEWNLRVDDEHLADLSADLKSLVDAFGDARGQEDTTSGAVADLRSGGFTTAGALDRQMMRFTLRVNDLARDFHELADGIDGVNVAFTDVEASARAGMDIVREGVSRLVGFETVTRQGAPEPTPVRTPEVGHIKGLYP